MAHVSAGVGEGEEEEEGEGVALTKKIIQRLKNNINKDNFMLYHFDDDNVLNYRNIKSTSKFDNLDVYNIEFNTMLKDEVNAGKRIKYLEIVRNNTQNINEKNI